MMMTEVTYVNEFKLFRIQSATDNDYTGEYFHIYSWINYFNLLIIMEGRNEGHTRGIFMTIKSHLMSNC